ncbi:MAG: suppressor of fused domain protein [Ruminococcaceae bacterium]|nr:suppressor of fused domain protein [Oscillospiraceae bacterium]
MNVKEMDKLTAHFNQYFEQDDCLVVHPIVDDGRHIDVLLYAPTEEYPFWKLATMGASDYLMPKIPNTVGRRNEYIMLVDKDIDLKDKEVLSWYHSKLLMIATFACCNKTHISYGHSFEWENEDADDEMVAAFVEFPQIVPDASMLHCKLGLFKKTACLQVVLLNQAELDRLMEIGPMAFSEYLYPENGGRCHYLSERHRSEKF